ncbi:MAG: hypothetical protein RL701_5694 [Pseudomonadota bacterium]|jgi:hypothetical protein
MRSPLIAFFAVTMNVTVACSAKPADFPVLVRAFDDQGRAVANVELAVAGSARGVTDAAGQRLLSLPGKEGDRLPFAATCPALNYDAPATQPELVLKRNADAQPVELSVTCPAKDHVALVAVRTGQTGAGVPILLRGQQVAVTSASGTAHVLVREPVGSAFQLTLDTGAKPGLRPASPTREFTVPQRDGFTVWDQPLRSGAANKRAKPRSQGPAIAPTQIPEP